MKIGALAQVAHCTAETVRSYEKAGLLAEPARTPGNFRVHGPEHLERRRYQAEHTLDACGILHGLAAMGTEQKPERHTHLG